MEITERDGSDEGDLVNRSTKKVRIRDIEENRDVDMETTTVASKTLSWKDQLLGIGFYPNERTTNTKGIEEDEDFELSEEDVERSSTNGSSSNRISPMNMESSREPCSINHSEMNFENDALGNNEGRFS
ncbi:hypothetical protein Golob_018113 [Gossypium lobatum]|uniref:Uncharacterized protein n=1 Tax=Gossypium lobatum TaxID=34289 RepID=A0A7J8M976_9ROSI|nr:hypothetical protein [Gossypium lobatum]